MAAAAKTSATRQRRRPLQTCAASMSGIIDTAYEKTGALGNFTKHLTRFATSTIPFASTMQNVGQTMISLTDDHILFLERVTETVFPPAGRVLDKIDELVYSAVQDLPDSPKKTESSAAEEVEEKLMLISSSSSKFAKSPDITTKSEVLSGQSSMVSSIEFAESVEQEQNDEIQGQSTEQEQNDEIQGQSTELDDEAVGKGSGKEFVESLDDKALGGGQSMVVSDHQEPPLSPIDEYITSSCAGGNGDSFDDEFEHVELPISSNDEDENYKDNFIHVSKPLHVGISSDHSHVAAIASSSSSSSASKKKASRKKMNTRFLNYLKQSGI